MHVLLVYGGDMKVMEEPTTEAALGSQRRQSRRIVRTFAHAGTSHRASCSHRNVDSGHAVNACQGKLEVLAMACAHESIGYFKPSFLPAESSSIDSRMRLSRVSGRLAV